MQKVKTWLANVTAGAGAITVKYFADDAAAAITRNGTTSTIARDLALTITDNNVELALSNPMGMWWPPCQSPAPMLGKELPGGRSTTSMATSSRNQ